MATVVVINPNEAQPFVRLRAALKNPRGLLKRIGAILEAGSQQAFEDQRLGSFIWPGRYPNSPAPFINVAGAVSDFASGSEKPKPRRFDRRPALRDTGNLLGSIRSRVVDDKTVEVGSTVPYAATHQWGLVSTTRMDKGTHQRMAKWLITDEGRPFQKKLTPLLSQSQLDTEVVQRPFLGVTKQMEEDIQDTVETMIAEASSGGRS